VAALDDEYVPTPPGLTLHEIEFFDNNRHRDSFLDLIPEPE
jgi:hypothetical protein